MIDGDAAFGQQLLDVPVRQRKPQVEALSRARTVVDNEGDDDEVEGHSRRMFQMDSDRRGLEPDLAD